MAVQPNQIKDLFSKYKVAGDRPPTQYEVSSLKNASPQSLANLPSTYAKYNPNSIVDYLKSTGQDPSMSSRQALGAKYGITNIGTAEGNTALLNALKSGKSTTPSTIPGAIQPNQTPPAYDKITGLLTDYGRSQGLPEVNAKTSLPGSIESAANAPTPEAPPATPKVAPELDVAKSAYVSAQRAVLDVTSKIDEINKSIDSAMANKRAEISRSGGVVDESQLRSTVLAENAPLLAERKDLLASRSQLVGEQNIAQKSYTDMINQQKQEELNAYRGAQLEQGQQKISQAGEKIDIQQEQFTQKEKDVANKLALSGMKVEKMNTYDEYGNVNGQALKIVDLNGKEMTGVPKLSTTGTYNSNSGATINSSLPGSPSKPSTTYNVSPSYIKEYIGNADKDTPQNTNLKVPGTMETVGSLYQDSMAWAFENGKLPTGVGRSTKAVSINTAEAIRQKGTAILNQLGMNQTEASMAYKSYGSSLTKLTGVYGQLLSNEGTADRNFKLLISLGQKMTDTSYSNPVPLINNWVKTGQINISGNPDVVAYAGQLQLTLNEYAKVISGQTGGAAVSDSARGEVGNLLSKGQNIQTVQDFYNNVVIPDLANRKAGANDAIKALISGATGGTGTGANATGGIPKGNMTSNQFVDKILTNLGMNYNDFIKAVPKGKIPVINNLTGETALADNDSEITSEYTRI